MTERQPRDDNRTSDEPTHSPDGVDLTLVRWMLSLTPEERLEVLQANVRSILRSKRKAVSPILRRTLEERRAK